MDDRDRAQLELVVAHAEAAMGYAREQGRAWWKDARTLDAVMMRITQVAEAAKRVSPAGQAEVEGVPWSSIRAMRSRLVHDYERVDVELVRGVVSHNLPALVRHVRRALAADG